MCRICQIVYYLANEREKENKKHLNGRHIGFLMCERMHGSHMQDTWYGYMVYEDGAVC